MVIQGTWLPVRSTLTHLRPLSGQSLTAPTRPIATPAVPEIDRPGSILSLGSGKSCLAHSSLTAAVTSRP